MDKYLAIIKQIVLSVVVERLARHAVDRYLMPQVEKIPVKRRKPFGFNQ